MIDISLSLATDACRDRCRCCIRRGVLFNRELFVVHTRCGSAFCSSDLEVGASWKTNRSMGVPQMWQANLRNEGNPLVLPAKEMRRLWSGLFSGGSFK